MIISYLKILSLIMGSRTSSDVSGVIVTVTSFGTIDVHGLSAYSLLKLKSNNGI